MTALFCRGKNIALAHIRSSYIATTYQPSALRVFRDAGDLSGKKIWHFSGLSVDVPSSVRKKIGRPKSERKKKKKTRQGLETLFMLKVSEEDSRTSGEGKPGRQVSVQTDEV